MTARANALCTRVDGSISIAGGRIGDDRVNTAPCALEELEGRPAQHCASARIESVLTVGRARRVVLRRARGP